MYALDAVGFWAVVIVLAPIAAIDSKHLYTDINKLESDQQKIQNTSYSLGQYQSTVATFTGLTNTLQNANTVVNALTPKMKDLTNAWAAINTDITNCMTDLTTASDYNNSDDWQDLLTEVTSIGIAWHSLVEALQLLILPVRGNNATLTPNMSSDQVKAALSAQPNVSIMDFISQPVYPPPAPPQ